MQREKKLALDKDLDLQTGSFEPKQLHGELEVMEIMQCEEVLKKMKIDEIHKKLEDMESLHQDLIAKQTTHTNELWPAGRN